MPKITVIMPSLNVAPFIRECVESVCAQTLRELEIFCVDAGSTDGTWEILQELANKDQRITLIHSEKRSYGYQVNLGIERATGEYTGIVETDDCIPPEMYELLYTEAKAQDLDILKADYYTFTGDGEKRWYTPCHIARKAWQYRRVFAPIDATETFFNTLYTWSGIYRTSFLQENHIRHNESPGASFQDNGFWFQTFALAKRVRYYRKPLYCLRRDNAGSSVFSKSKCFCESEEFDFIRAFLHQHPTIEGKLAPICAYLRFSTCLYFTLNRLDDDNKRILLEKVSSEFRTIEADGEWDRSLFTKREWETMQAIKDSPDSYFKLRAEKKLPTCEGGIIRRGMHCVRDHGLVYTVRYLLYGKGMKP